MFDITNIRDSDVILEFPWLETAEPLIFWAQRTVVFPEKPNIRIPLRTVSKGKLLHFNAIYPKELMARLQEEKPQIKIL